MLRFPEKGQKKSAPFYLHQKHMLVRQTRILLKQNFKKENKNNRKVNPNREKKHSEENSNFEGKNITEQVTRDLRFAQFHKRQHNFDSSLQR